MLLEALRTKSALILVYSGIDILGALDSIGTERPDVLSRDKRRSPAKALHYV